MNRHRTASAAPTANGQSIFFIDKRNHDFFRDHTYKLYSPAEHIKSTIVFFAVVNLILFLILGWNTWRWWQFTMNGVITEAKVVEREIDRSGDSDSYYLTYVYQARVADHSRQSFTNRDRVGYSNYQRYEPGTYLLIRYLKDDPTSATSKWHQWWIWQLIVGYGIALFLLWHVCFRLPRSYRNRVHTILTQGKVLPGRILTSAVEDDDDNYKIKLIYEFTMPTTGRLLKGSVTETRNDLKRQALPTPGTLVAVMYLAETDFFLL